MTGPPTPVLQQLSPPPDQSPKMGGLKGSGGLKQPAPPEPPANLAQVQAPPPMPPAPPVPPAQQPDLKQGEALVMGQKVNYEAMTKEKGQETLNNLLSNALSFLPPPPPPPPPPKPK